ncbi:unnamed protein product [Brassica oleracea]|uniref:Hyccin n=1 Tax=Brassica oleracea TaxID=3712 RepID=A0A3P6DBK5_BRAOL|nr:unnamed protein product [Brassica oleracea]
MDFSVKPNGGSPSPSSSTTPHRLKSAAATASDRDPMHSWWESVSKQRSRILSLSSLLSGGDEAPISSLADSDRPALSLLSSRPAYSLISASLRDPSSGSGSDPLCQWLYETYLSSDHPLRLVVLSFLPLLAGTYLSRIHSSDSSSLPSLSGFEAVLLAIYAAEVKSRAGKGVLVHIPDLSQPSLYHTPRNGVDRSRDSNHVGSVGVLSPQLEPQVAVKSTKRAGIVGVGMQCYFKEISQMPAWSKLELCSFAGAWAGQDCDCKEKIDGEGDKVLALTNGFVDSSSSLNGSSEIEAAEEEEEEEEQVISSNGVGVGVGGGGVRIPLPWELLQPILRILGHCLLSPLNSEDVKDAASNAVRSLYARASHDLNPQAILATRSLVNLDASARAAAKTASAESVDGSSNVNTPSKSKKPEIFLSSK